MKKKDAAANGEIAINAISQNTHIESAVDVWFGSMLQSVGPLVSTQAYNAISGTRDNLKAVMVAAVTTK